jgi:hypothetical protein
MITFSELQKRLALGQLKNTSAVDEDNLGVIDVKYDETILSIVNQGLVDISSRIPINKSQVVLSFIDNQNMYSITELGLNNYLTDTVDEPFIDDRFIKVLDIFDENGNRHSINTNGHIMQPSFNTLRFTNSKIEELSTIGTTSGKITIRYQQKHPTISYNDNIDLPPDLETALQLFVASLFISHIGSEVHSAKGDSYFATYLRYLGENENRDLSATSEIEKITKFQERGFV